MKVRWSMVFVLMLTAGFAQDHLSSFQVMFYNVENFFDPFEDSLTRDEEFTPDGSRRWTYSRFMQKAVKIARVIIASGDPDPPLIIGLAEVENRFVLQKLVYETPLSPLHYGIVHQDSPDARGIDVALLYRKEFVTIDTFFCLSVRFEGSDDRTRDILLARCLLFEKDTLLVVVNHWPSRYGGAAGSAHKRAAAALTLREYLEVACLAGKDRNVLVMGDFNDEPSDHSLQLLRQGTGAEKSEDSMHLINLSPAGQEVPGTMKYGGFWYLFDQVIITDDLLKGSHGLLVEEKKAAIFSAAFLLETDNSHLGRKPFRTFLGPAFHNGYSDHLPVLVTICTQGHF